MPISITKYDRRSFIKTLTLGVAGVVLGGSVKSNRRSSEYFILLSDPHIHYDEGFSSATYSDNGKKMASNFKQIVSRILNQSKLPHGVIINGDLAWRNGHPAHYRLLRKLVKPLLQQNIEVYMTLGNHDDRESFYGTLSDYKSESYSVSESHVMVIDSPNAYLVLLDSLDKVEEIPGRLGRLQLNWLDNLLSTLGDKAVNLFAHHYPESGNGKGMLDYPQLQKIMNRHDQVKAFIYGHSHAWDLSTKKAFYHINIPSTGYSFSEEQPLGFVHAEFNPEGINLRLDCLDRQHPWHSEEPSLTYSDLGLKNGKGKYDEIRIKNVYPNPFRIYTNVRFHLLNTSYLSANLFTVTGRKVKTIMRDTRFLPGEHQFQLDANNLASGNYLIQLKTDNFSRSRVVTLVK